MGTDRSEHKKPCPCGKGTILVGCNSPDHGWASAYSVHWDCEIEWPDCRRDYVVDGTDQSMRIVRRSDVATAAVGRQAHDAAYRRLMALPEVAALKRDFGIHLDAMRTVATIHRYLTAEGLESYAIGSFRKHWNGGAAWAEQHVGSWNLSKIANLLADDGSRFATDVAAVETLKTAITGLPTVMVRIPTKSATDSDVMSAACSD
jgi:hypothetical protein